MPKDEKTYGVTPSLDLSPSEKRQVDIHRTGIVQQISAAFAKPFPGIASTIPGLPESPWDYRSREFIAERTRTISPTELRREAKDAAGEYAWKLTYDTGTGDYHSRYSQDVKSAKPTQIELGVKTADGKSFTFALKPRRYGDDLLVTVTIPARGQTPEQTFSMFSDRIEAKGPDFVGKSYGQVEATLTQIGHIVDIGSSIVAARETEILDEKEREKQANAQYWADLQARLDAQEQERIAQEQAKLIRQDQEALTLSRQTFQTILDHQIAEDPLLPADKKPKVTIRNIYYFADWNDFTKALQQNPQLAKERDALFMVHTTSLDSNTVGITIKGILAVDGSLQNNGTIEAGYILVNDKKLLDTRLHAAANRISGSGTYFIPSRYPDQSEDGKSYAAAFRSWEHRIWHRISYQ